MTFGLSGRRQNCCIAKLRRCPDSDTMPSSGLAVLVIDENRVRASIIEEGLREAGHEQVTVVNDVTGLARRIAELNPDVIVIDLENSNRDQLEAMFQLSRAVKRPIAMFVDRADLASIEAAVDAGVSAYAPTRPPRRASSPKGTSSPSTVRAASCLSRRSPRRASRKTSRSSSIQAGFATTGTR